MDKPEEKLCTQLLFRQVNFLKIVFYTNKGNTRSELYQNDRLLTLRPKLATQQGLQLLQLPFMAFVVRVLDVTR